ncbi:MAG: DoxX family protein [Bdellovibrionaceae bacterium]|nr:DoxX family protein [Pseudobdellovibrionaceae bacterium]
MLKVLFSATNAGESRKVSLAFLLLRVFVGVAMMAHGYKKIMNPFGWMGPDAAVPEIFQALAALSEFGGGLALVIGLLIPLSMLGMAITMAVAVYVHVQKGDGFVGGWELAGVYLAAAVFFLLAGPGRWSADAILRSKVK